MDEQDIHDKDFYAVFFIILSILYIHVNIFNGKYNGFTRHEKYGAVD
jgi:hypothetical protein